MKNIGLMYYLKKHKWGCFAYCFFLTLGTACETLSTVLFANSVALITTNAFSEGIHLLIICGVLAVMKRASYFLINYFYITNSTLIQTEIAKDLTNRSFLLSSSTFSENNTGAFLQRIMDDPIRALECLSEAFDLITSIISRVVVIAYIITLNWLIGILYVVMLGAMTFVERYRMKKRKAGRSAIKKMNDETYSLMGEIIRSERDIKALDLDQELYSITDKQFASLRKKKRSVEILDSTIRQCEIVILELFSVAVLILGINLMNKNLIAMSTYILLFSYRSHIWFFVWEVGHVGQRLQEMRISTGRMFSLFNEGLFPIDKFGVKSLKKPKGKITFSHVEFAYINSKEILPSKKGERIRYERTKLPPLFKDLSFEVNPNTTVAFVGESGGGKSTILSLISKLIECDKGSIKIDGTNIKDLTKDSLRTTISLINQTPYIFDMTVRENLKLVKDNATDEELWDALKRASFDRDVEAMANKLDTKVGETGIKLSGGQRQRLAIARALLKNSKIILFDESTSSLDNFAQSRIQQSIDGLKGKHTIIIVAHRLSTIKNVDKIYFLDKGEIADSGTFEELYNNNEKFRDMFLVERI